MSFLLEFEPSQDLDALRVIAIRRRLSFPAIGPGLIDPLIYQSLGWLSINMGVPEHSQDRRVRHVEIDARSAGQRIDNFLMSHLKKVPRSLVYRLMRTGQVRINGKRCKPFAKLKLNDVVRIPPVSNPQGSRRAVPDHVVDQIASFIDQETDDYLVINKPSGVAVHGGSGIEYGVIEAMKQARPDAFLELGHRLDRFTSGCLVLAKSRDALTRLHRQLRERSVTKRYLALLSGRLPEDQVVVDFPLRKISGQSGDHRVVVDIENGKPSLSVFRRLEASRRATYAEIDILTGRTHQIRAHARAIGHPLVGDSKYALSESAQAPSTDEKAGSFYLHCAHIHVPAENDSDELLVHINLPDTFAEAMDRLI